MPARHLRHVVLTTGIVRTSLRSDVPNDAIEAAAALLKKAHTEPARISGLDPAYAIRVDGQGRCLVATVHGPDGTACVTLGIATHSRCGRSLWRRLHEGRTDLATDRSRVPPEPWCAERTELGATLPPELAEQIAPLLASLGWAAVERPPHV